MVIYYYDLGEGQIYQSNRNIDYRMLTKSIRCFKMEYGNVQVLRDHSSKWNDYPISEKEISWIILKAKVIPRSWYVNNI